MIVPITLTDGTTQNTSIEKCGRLCILHLRVNGVTFAETWTGKEIGRISDDSLWPATEVEKTYVYPNGTSAILHITSAGLLTLQVVTAIKDSSTGFWSDEIPYIAVK